MRTARIRNDREQCFFHVVNRVSGMPGYLPFGEVEKEKLFTLFEKLQRFYTVELMSVVVMSNHFHAVCCTSPELPDTETVKANYRAFHGSKRAEPDWENPEIVRQYAERMRDVSSMMKDAQQLFTNWFNRRWKRRGRLWADRFKSVVLEGNNAVWECVKYIEMNPVRAGLVEDPADYRFCSWGRYAGGGKHPFREAFQAHVGRAVADRLPEQSFRAVADQFLGELARVAAAERGETAEDISQAKEQAKRGVPFRTTITRRMRYWSDGAIIGSRAFVERFGQEVFGQERMRKKRFERHDASGLVSFRQLRRADL